LFKKTRKFKQIIVPSLKYYELSLNLSASLLPQKFGAEALRHSIATSLPSSKGKLYIPLSILRIACFFDIFNEFFTPILLLPY